MSRVPKITGGTRGDIQRQRALLRKRQAEVDADESKSFGSEHQSMARAFAALSALESALGGSDVEAMRELVELIVPALRLRSRAKREAAVRAAIVQMVEMMTGHVPDGADNGVPLPALLDGICVSTLESRKLAAMASREEAERDRARGALIERSVVADAWTKEHVVLRLALEDLPRRGRFEHFDDGADVHRWYRDRIAEALGALSVEPPGCPAMEPVRNGNG